MSKIPCRIGDQQNGSTRPIRIADGYRCHDAMSPATASLGKEMIVQLRTPATDAIEVRCLIKFVANNSFLLGKCGVGVLQMTNIRKTMTGLFCCLALCSGSSLAAAAPMAASVPALNPYAAIGLYGSPEAAAALCSNAATSAAVGAAAMAQSPAQGCVLPVTDPVAPPVAQPAPMPVAAVAPTGLGITPILLGLLGIAGIAALIASQSSGRGGNTPPPISPA